jgi:hypothetical protein
MVTYENVTKGLKFLASYKKDLLITIDEGAGTLDTDYTGKVSETHLEKLVAMGWARYSCLEHNYNEALEGTAPGATYWYWSPACTDEEEYGEEDDDEDEGDD